MRTKLRIIAPIAFIALIAGGAASCTSAASMATAPLGDFGSFKGATIEVTARGGIAALSINHRVDHDTRGFLYTMRHICDRSCPAALDSAAGTLAPAAADSLFNIAIEQSRFLLKSDYGVTPNAADMMTYTLRISADGQTRSIVADDGTMPEPMRRIVDSVRGIVSAARK